MSNINVIQGAGYGQSAGDSGAPVQDTSQGGFGLAMGQVSAASAALTPAVAQSLMNRSMSSTGVPTAELEKYGGYDAVKAVFDANGGVYSRNANDTTQFQRGQDFSVVSGTGTATTLTLTPSIAKGLMYRSMTTGVPTSEMNQYGGYDAVKAMFDAGSGSYGLDAIPAEQRKSLATVVAVTGVGNMSAPVAEKVGLSAQVLHSMASNGVDKTTIDQLSQKTASFELPPFIDTQSYISTFMKNF